MARTVGRARRQPPPGIKAAPCPRQSSGGAALARAWGYCRYCYRLVTVLVRKKQLFCINSEHIALPKCLLRYVSHGAGSAQGAASRRRPLYPRAPASNIATAWCLRLIPAGFGSGRGSVLAKHGPQPASMRAAPAFRERLSDVEAATPAVSAAPCSAAIHILGLDPVGRVRRQPPPGKITAQQGCLEGNQRLPGGAALARAWG